MSPSDPRRYSPSRRDLFRPVELLGLSAVVAVAVGIVVFISTRTFEVAVIFAGLSFIVTLVVLAMLALTAKPNREEQTDLREQDQNRHGVQDAATDDDPDRDRATGDRGH